MPCNTHSPTYRVIDGENARFDCEIDANPDADDIYWEDSIGTCKVLCILRHNTLGITLIVHNKYGFGIVPVLCNFYRWQQFYACIW